MHPHFRRGHGHRWDIPQRTRLQRRLFFWFGATIVITGLLVGLVVALFGPGGWHGHYGPPYGYAGPRPRGHGTFFFALVAAVGTLWVASAFIARRLTRPLAELVRVTRAIGDGDLGARVRLGRHQTGEVGALADSVNEMAARIERQLREERELLATVSHELRSPLARLRVLVELARSEQDGEARLAEIEREILGIDALIGKLLASSRLEFGAMRPQPLVAREAALRALEAAGLGPELLVDESAGASVEADPTLLARAIGNLLENAALHAGGVERLLVRPAPGVLRFEVKDTGPGFSEEDLTRAFEAFHTRGTIKTGGAASLGLGLALVTRIARAHGGRAFAENTSGGGATVVLELPVKPLA